MSPAWLSGSSAAYNRYSTPRRSQPEAEGAASVKGVRSQRQVVELAGPSSRKRLTRINDNWNSVLRRRSGEKISSPHHPSVPRDDGVDELKPGMRQRFRVRSEVGSRRGPGERDRRLGRSPAAIISRLSPSPASVSPPTSASFAIPDTPSPGSSPCRPSRDISPPWGTPRAGASRPWFLTSNRGGSASNRPICAIPTVVSPPELVEGLILVMSLALYWAVSTDMGDQANHPIPAPNPGRKKRPDRQPAKRARGRLSWFTRGLRRAIKLLLECLPLPKLWECLLN